MPLSYDEVPYPSYAYSYTHPDTLATRAVLMGMRPAPVERCRVLELGCAGGGNLLPMAVGLPNSEFIGIDYAARQVAEGLAALSALGIKNATLRHLDIMDVDASMGVFDYIIVHGIYSWVPEAVRAKILEVCRENLAPQGVAYISFNAYPGWHMLGAIRGMMLYHTRNIREPQLRAAQARALVDFLVEAVPSQSEGPRGIFDAYGNFLKSELKRLKENTDSYVLHDELEENNQPFYFYEFADHIDAHELSFLCEADFSSDFPGSFPANVNDGLLQMARDVVEMEQYMDFSRLRSFRRPLIVHQGALADRSVRAERVAALLATTQAAPVSAKPDLAGVSAEQFKAADGSALTTDHPPSKAAMIAMARLWPRVAPVPEILDLAYNILGTPAAERAQRAAQDEQVLCANLLRAFAYSERLVELRTFAPPFTLDVTERPVATPWARLQAETTDSVTNTRHERVEVGGMARFLLRQLDGTRDHAELVDSARRPVSEGSLSMHKDGKAVAPDAALATLETEVEESLAQLARYALLVA